MRYWPARFNVSESPATQSRLSSRFACSSFRVRGAKVGPVAGANSVTAPAGPTDTATANSAKAPLRTAETATANSVKAPPRSARAPRCALPSLRSVQCLRRRASQTPRPVRTAPLAPCADTAASVTSEARSETRRYERPGAFRLCAVAVPEAHRGAFRLFAAAALVDPVDTVALCSRPVQRVQQDVRRVRDRRDLLQPTELPQER